MARALIGLGHVREAYTELSPMLDRVLAAADFYEWWTRDNRSMGAKGYRGAAGVLGMALIELKLAVRSPL